MEDNRPVPHNHPVVYCMPCSGLIQNREAKQHAAGYPGAGFCFDLKGSLSPNHPGIANHY